MVAGGNHSAMDDVDLYTVVFEADVENAALFVGELAATPKMKGQAPGSVAWAREAVELNGLFGGTTAPTGVADEH